MPARVTAPARLLLETHAPIRGGFLISVPRLSVVARRCTASTAPATKPTAAKQQTLRTAYRGPVTDTAPLIQVNRTKLHSMPASNDVASASSGRRR